MNRSALDHFKTTMVLCLIAALSACGGGSTGGGGSGNNTTTTSADKAWGMATLIETDNAGGATRPQIAVDASGNALAVWQQSDGTRFNIWANTFR